MPKAKGNKNFPGKHLIEIPILDSIPCCVPVCGIELESVTKNVISTEAANVLPKNDNIRA